MKPSKGNPGISRLAGVLLKQMQKTGEMPAGMDFGAIQVDGSLVTNNFPVPIPATDYLVCRGLTFGKVDSVLTSTVDELHSVKVPEVMRSVQAGDRVLVVWAGNDAVVVDIIVPAAQI